MPWPGRSSQGAALHKIYYVWIREGRCENDLALPSDRYLEDIGPGAAAHMSLHLDQQCQRAQKTDALADPLLGDDPGVWFLMTAA